MNVAVRRDDERCIEVVVSGLPLYHDAQLAVDITMRSAVTRSGEARSGAARVDGIVCMNARADEEQKYAEELLAGDRCRPWRPEGDGVQKPQGSLMVSLGLRTGGPTQPGAVGLFGVEEEMVSDAFRLLRKSVRHFLAVRARGAARVSGADGSVPDATDL